MEKINILFLVISLNVGGTERHLLNLVSHLNREKFNPVICCLYDLGAIGEQLVNDNRNIRAYANALNSKYHVWGVWRVLQIIQKENIHILYTINLPLTQLWGTLIAKFSGLKAFVTRVLDTKPRWHGTRRRIINKIMLPFVDRIIAQADTHKKYLMEYENIKGEKIEVVYNGVELEKFDIQTDKLEFKKNLGIDIGNPIVGIVARLAPEKGHPVFLKAAKKVLSEFPQASFLIVGDGEEKQKMENLSRELAIESNVFFLGMRKDIPQTISIFDVAVLSSYPMVETLSNAILEYMAAGKPVVATNVGSTVDIVIEAETGFLVDSNDADAMADAVLKLLRDRNLAEKMGAAGRERVKERFTIEKMMVRYESLFTDLVKEH